MILNTTNPTNIQVNENGNKTRTNWRNTTPNHGRTKHMAQQQQNKFHIQHHEVNLDKHNYQSRDVE